MHPRLRHKRLSLGLAFAASVATYFFSAAASAQQPLDPDLAPYLAVTHAPRSASLPSLALPRAELITGLALVHLSFPVGAVVSLFLGPPFFACGLNLFGELDESDPEYQRCERDADRQRRHAAQGGMWSGLAVGLVGSILTLDGAMRIKRTRALWRSARFAPYSYGVVPSAGRAVAQVGWRF